MTIRLLTLLLLTSCSTRQDNNSDSYFGHEIDFEKTELSETIDLIQVDDHSIKIITDSLDAVLRTIKQIDTFEQSHYRVYSDTCDQTIVKTWKCKTHKCVATRMTKSKYDWYQTGVKVRLTEFDIFRLEEPRRVTIKLINDREIHEIAINDRIVNVLKESIIKDIETGFEVFQRQKKQCN